MTAYNYFLAYDNSVPVFIGGPQHGKRDVAVPANYRSFRIAEPPPRDYLDGRNIDNQGQLSIGIHQYWERWLVCDDGREFRMMVHDALPVSAAIMLLFSSFVDGAGEIARLTAENFRLKQENAMLRRELARKVW